MVAITEKRSLSSTTPEIIYPSSDGEPLAETQQHVSAILFTFGLLRQYLQNQQAVVFADQFLYYVEGNPKARVAPDVMVVFDITKKLYGNYKIWEGKQNPAIIIEVTSAGTKDTDFNFKKTLYEQLGVTEYWLFDPYGEWITEQLRGYRLNAAGMYEPITGYCSQVLELRLEADEYLINFYRLDNGAKLRNLDELDIAIQKAEQRADQESQRADQESQRANRLAEKLRQLGVELDEYIDT
jgi:Uma2 family endonuclease